MNYNEQQPGYNPDLEPVDKDGKKSPSDNEINSKIDTLKLVTLIYGGTMLALSLIFLILMKRYENVKGISAAEVERQRLLKRRSSQA